MSTDELKNYGYSDAQIAILKNPNSTDAELRSASSKITVTTVVEKLEHLKDNYTYSTVYLEWMWKTIPTSQIYGFCCHRMDRRDGIYALQ